MFSLALAQYLAVVLLFNSDLVNNLMLFLTLGHRMKHI